MIRASDEIQGAKRKRAESEARSNVEAEIWEKAEKTRKAKKAKAKAEAETVESARVWAEANAKEKAVISRVNAEARERAMEEAKKRL